MAVAYCLFGSNHNFFDEFDVSIKSVLDNSYQPLQIFLLVDEAAKHTILTYIMNKEARATKWRFPHRMYIYNIEAAMDDVVTTVNGLTQQKVPPTLHTIGTFMLCCLSFVMIKEKWYQANPNFENF